MIRPRPGGGDIEVFAADQQTDETVDLARWVGLARAVLAGEGVHGPAELSLEFVDEARMAELNGEHMGQPGPTDVLAFPIDDDGPIGAGVPRLLGDVVICPTVAARNAPDHAGSYDDELALLVVHGVLHILGMDHAEPEETAVMQAREREHLARFAEVAS